MIDFAMLIEEELEHQRKLYAESRRLLQRAPDGALRKRKRKKRTDYGKSRPGRYAASGS